MTYIVGDKNAIFPYSKRDLIDLILNRSQTYKAAKVKKIINSMKNGDIIRLAAIYAKPTLYIIAVNLGRKIPCGRFA